MEKKYIAVVLAALVLVVLELPSCEAGCRGGGGVQCVTNDDCTDGYICVNGTCKLCSCRLASECYVGANGNVRCNCSDGYHGKYCYCMDCEDCNIIPIKCEMGWEHFDGHCYMMETKLASHRDAMDNCAFDHNGWLVEIQSLAEHNFLINQVFPQLQTPPNKNRDRVTGRGPPWEELPFPARRTKFVIGGSFDTDAYVWANSSTPVDNTLLLWAPGYPRAIEGCMAYEFQEDATWKWIAMESTSDCIEYQTLYVCEKESL